MLNNIKFGRILKKRGRSTPIDLQEILNPDLILCYINNLIKLEK
ncbi:unnamed protein product, partial [marine sediment metagenome]